MSSITSVGNQWFMVIKDISLGDLQWIAEQIGSFNETVHCGTLFDGLDILCISVDASKSKDPKAALDFVMLLKLKFA